MSEYQLELKQVVDYPRCRIYRQLIRSLMDDRSIRVSGGSGLFYYTVLCSYANFRTSYRNLDGINYTIRPGEWICRISEAVLWFQVRFQHQAFAILDVLQAQHFITYSRLGRGNIIKFSITDWHRHNTVLEYNAPCQKDTGFFFLPVSVANELVSLDRCSEADVILDLWVSTVYNDPQVESSDIGPVVYIRNGTGQPLIGYSELAARWGVSKTTVCRILKKLETLDYLTLIPFTGRHGSVIYLKNYLSTMFQISDIMVDKQEIAMSLNIKINMPAAAGDCDTGVDDDRICVSKDLACVPNSHIRAIVFKVAEILTAQGFVCGECRKISYMLSPLSAGRIEILHSSMRRSRDNEMHLSLCIHCSGSEVFAFEITLTHTVTGGNENG